MKGKLYNTWIMGKNGVPELVPDELRTKKINNLKANVYAPDMSKKEDLGISC